MIICHERKLIFLKSRKVAGTAFEIALSTVCTPGDIVTRLLPEDERLRATVGGREGRDVRWVRWPGRWLPSRVSFRNHSPAHEVLPQLPPAIRGGYRTVAITRNPYDVAISRYYWRRSRGALPPEMSFGAFVAAHPRRLSANARIAPVDGPYAVQTFLRHAHLVEDLAAHGLGDLAGLIGRIRPKGGARPSAGTDRRMLYACHPEAAEIVARTCAAEIARFGYTLEGED